MAPAVSSATNLCNRQLNHATILPRINSIQMKATITISFFNFQHIERRGIYSIDIHPNGDQFLTGGGDGKVKLWSMFPVMDEEYELDGQSPKLLFTGTSHTGSVNCVRWSQLSLLRIIFHFFLCLFEFVCEINFFSCVFANIFCVWKRVSVTFIFCV